MVTGCNKGSNDDPKSTIPPELIGKWKIVELYTSDGSNAYWHVYDSGRVWDKWFKSDGTYLNTDTDLPIDCMSGNYTVNNNYIQYSNSPCVPEEPVIIESLSNRELTIDGNFFEPIKTKYIKVIE